MAHLLRFRDFGLAGFGLEALALSRVKLKQEKVCQDLRIPLKGIMVVI